MKSSGREGTEGGGLKRGECGGIKERERNLEGGGGQRFYTKSENKEQESRYVRRGVMGGGGLWWYVLWLIRPGCPQGTGLML